MIEREQLVNKLRALGFSFKKQCDRTTLWQKGVERAFVPRRDFVSDAAARSILLQCGATEAEADTFIRSANS